MTTKAEGGHYFDRTQRAAHRPSAIAATLRGERLEFATDTAVFARSRIDPGTKLLVDSAALSSGARVLDWGCGYGAIGLALAKSAQDCFVVMVDVNERAVRLAARNAKANGIANAAALWADGFAAFRAECFDAVVTNPPIRAGNSVVFSMIRSSRNHLRTGGALWLVVRTRQGADSVYRVMGDVFGSVRIVARGGGYKVLRAAKE